MALAVGADKYYRFPVSIEFLNQLNLEAVKGITYFKLNFRRNPFSASDDGQLVQHATYPLRLLITSRINPVEKHEYLNFNGNKLKVPYKHIEYLNFVYGDWGQPKLYQFGEKYGYGEKTHMPELKTLNEDIILF